MCPSRRARFHSQSQILLLILILPIMNRLLTLNLLVLPIMNYTLTLNLPVLRIMNYLLTRNLLTPSRSCVESYTQP